MSNYEKTPERFARYLAWAEYLESDGWPKDCSKTYKESYRMMSSGNWPDNDSWKRYTEEEYKKGMERWKQKYKKNARYLGFLK
jgi:hypothetical protein